MDIWFCSDFHLGHFNIIRYCGRPFTTLSEMDLTIIRNFNERVKEDDMCFFLGDFCFKKSGEAIDSPKNAFEYYRGQLRCKNIIFLKGNHDKNNSIKTPIQSMVIQHGGKRIFLTHDPIFAKHEYELNFCGHVHEKWRFKRISPKSIVCNVAVEQYNYFPVMINEIFQQLSTWEKHEN